MEKEKKKARYSKEEEKINTITHGIGAVGTLIVCGIFAMQVYEKGNGLDLLSIILMLLGVSVSYIFSPCRIPMTLMGWSGLNSPVTAFASVWHSGITSTFFFSLSIFTLLYNKS